MASKYQVQRFIEDIVEVCFRHNLTLAHEDSQGGFLVEPFSDDNIKQLRAAENMSDDMEPKDA